MSDDPWYYIFGAEQKGPASEDEMYDLIEACVIYSDTLVSTDRLATWTPLRNTTLAIPRLRPCEPPVEQGDLAVRAIEPSQSELSQ